MIWGISEQVLSSHCFVPSDIMVGDCTNTHLNKSQIIREMYKLQLFLSSLYELYFSSLVLPSLTKVPVVWNYVYSQYDKTEKWSAFFFFHSFLSLTYWGLIRYIWWEKPRNTVWAMQLFLIKSVWEVANPHSLLCPKM